MNPEVKPWWASKGVWGGIIAAVAGVAGLFGVQVLPEDQAVLADVVTAVVGSLGGALAVWGRIRASQRLS